MGKERMIDNLYVNKELLNNNIEYPIKHFDEILSNFEMNVRIGAFNEIKSLTTFRMLQGFKDVHLNKYKQIVIPDIKSINFTNTISEIQKLRRETTLILAAEFDFTSIFKKQDEISDRDFKEINEFIENLINSINQANIEKEIKDEIIEELNKIKEKLSKETKKLQIVNSELLTWTDKLFFMNIKAETKKEIIELGTKIFNKIRISIVSCIPEIKEMKIDINAKLTLDWKKAKGEEEEVIDVEVEENNQITNNEE